MLGAMSRRFTLVVAILVPVGLGVSPASADVVVGDRIDVSGVVGHADGTQTFRVSYSCAATSTYADLWVKTRQLDGLQQTKVFGHGELGMAPVCTGATHSASVTVSASDPAQWLTGGIQHFWVFFCDSVSAAVCDVDTGNDASVNGARLVLSGKGGVPPAVPDDFVIASEVDHATGQLSGTYTCPTGVTHAGLGGQIVQEQGLLNPRRVDFSWASDTDPTCDGTVRSFTATATADQAGETLTAGDRATDSAAFTAVDSQTRATGSNMQISQNGGNYASAPLALA